MITREELKTQARLFTQSAWKIDRHTTINDMIEYVVGEISAIVADSCANEIDRLTEELKELKAQFNSLASDVEAEQKDNQELVLTAFKIYKEEIDGSKEGGLQKPQGRKKATD